MWIDPSGYNKHDLKDIDIILDDFETIVDERKFSEYIFKEGSAPGKKEVYDALGYTKENSELLAEIYKQQAKTKYLNGDYTNGKLDECGQRINIEIELSSLSDTERLVI